jgi:hypothetical protein
MHIPAVPAERSRPGMSTGRITAAALQIVDTEGSQALTMRRLGQALDRKMMTLYRYVPGKDALLDGVVARVLTDLAINPAAADWRQELRGLATSFGASRSLTPTRYRCWSPGRSPARSGNGRQPPCGPWKISLNCSSAPGSALPTHCTPTGCSSDSCTDTSSTSYRNHRQPRRGRRPAPARPAPPPPPRIPPGYAPWPPSSPATTEPPISSKASH